jgi:hypothetical protein
MADGASDAAEELVVLSMFSDVREPSGNYEWMGDRTVR